MPVSSEKTKVIELIFNDKKRWKNNTLAVAEVTFDDVKEAIASLKAVGSGQNVKLSESNPANFFKDLMRKHNSLIRNWPESVKVAGYYGEQAKGEKLCFRFIKYNISTHGTAQPPPYPMLGLKVYHAQTLSVNPLNKALARNDENWLMAIASTINIPQIHFTLHSTAGWAPTSLNHVQSNMKLRGAEIDGVFLLEEDGGKIGLLCVEAKGFNDDIIESQLVDQVKAAQKAKGFRRLDKEPQDGQSNLYIIPAALKLYRKNNFPLSNEEIVGLPSDQVILYFIHYEPVNANSKINSLPPAIGQTAFLLRPSIAGL